MKGPFGELDHFDAGNPVGLVVVEDNAGREFFRFNDGGVVEAELEGVGFFVDVEFYGFVGLLRSHEFYSLPGCNLAIDLAGGHFFKENFLECFRVVRALSGTEDFDAGGAVHNDVM